MPDISIIVPVYNAEKYVSRCIDSILKQSFFNFELILVDDGSNDNSGIICDKYAGKDKRICVIHKENGGVSSARNYGIDKAIGKYISFCDADDYLEKNFLQHSYDICEKNQVDLYKSPYIVVNDKWKEKKESYVMPKLFRHSKDIPESDYVFPLVQSYISNCWSSLIRRDIIENIRFDICSTFGEDTKFIFDLLKNNICFYADNLYLYNYVRTPGSITSSVSVEKCKSIKDHYLFFFNFSKYFSGSGNQWYEYVEKLCSEDIYWSIKMILASDYSLSKKHKMLCILLSEQIFIDSCLKYYHEFRNHLGTMTVNSILFADFKKKLKHRIRKMI